MSTDKIVTFLHDFKSMQPPPVCQKTKSVRFCTTSNPVTSCLSTDKYVTFLEDFKFIHPLFVNRQICHVSGGFEIHPPLVCHVSRFCTTSNPVTSCLSTDKYVTFLQDFKFIHPLFVNRKICNVSGGFQIHPPLVCQQTKVSRFCTLPS